MINKGGYGKQDSSIRIGCLENPRGEPWGEGGGRVSREGEEVGRVKMGTSVSFSVRS